jgi:hypothetical protein
MQSQQVNAEEMLAEVKRVLETSTPAPDVPPPLCVDRFQSSSLGRKSLLSKNDRGNDRSFKATTDTDGQPTDLQKPTRPSSLSWKLTAGGLALAGVAMISGSFALVNKAPSLPKRELSAVATKVPVRSQKEEAFEPSSDARSVKQDGRQAALLQIGNSGTQPDVNTAPVNGSSLAARGEARVDAPFPASLGLESVAPVFPVAPVTPPATAVASQMIRPDGTPTATVPAAPASTESVPLAETPKSNVTPTTRVSNESARPLIPKNDSKKKPAGKTSLQKPANSAKASAKSVVQAERQSTEPARPKEAERSPQPGQDTGNPTAAAPVTATTVQQRFADGMTHAFSYVMHLPGALVPHPTDPNADAH